VQEWHHATTHASAGIAGDVRLRHAVPNGKHGTAVLDGLAGKSMAVRQNAVKDLGIIGTHDDIPLLRRVADEDPGVLLPDKKTRRYFVRETAQKSIADINRRFLQH